MAFCQSFLVFSAAYCSTCGAGGKESYAASHGTVNFGIDSDIKDVLTGVRSMESTELKVVENGNM